MITLIDELYARDMIREFLEKLKDYDGIRLEDIKEGMIAYDFIAELSEAYDKDGNILGHELDTLLCDYTIDSFARVLCECTWLSYDAIGSALVYWVTARDALFEHASMN